MADRACSSCGGTGWWWLAKSCFAEDGHNRKHCNICRGSGVSDYRDDAVWCRRQAELRAANAERPAKEAAHV